MSRPDEMLLATAAKIIIDSIHFGDHKNIKKIHASYDYNPDSHEYIPKIIIELRPSDDN